MDQVFSWGAVAVLCSWIIRELVSWFLRRRPQQKLEHDVVHGEIGIAETEQQFQHNKATFDAVVEGQREIIDQLHGEIKRLERKSDAQEKRCDEQLAAITEEAAARSTEFKDRITKIEVHERELAVALLRSERRVDKLERHVDYLEDELGKTGAQFTRWRDK